MKIVIQRVKYASVTIEGKVHGKIDGGIMALIGFKEGDEESLLKPMAEKMTGLRIFEDENERMNLSLSDVGGDILAISQFTLYADCRKGKRPSFTDALKPDKANEFYEKFVKICEDLTGRKIETGIFGADMKVSLLNDGPVTIVLDTDTLKKEK